MAQDDPKARLHRRMQARIVWQWHRTMESDRHVNMLIFLLAISTGLLIIGAFSLSLHPRQLYAYDRGPSVPQLNPRSVLFKCSHGRFVAAKFGDRAVLLTLPDGREILVAQEYSYTTTRYSNTDGSFLFWNEGTSALIFEDGEITYRDCISDN